MIISADFAQASQACESHADRWEGPGAGIRSAWLAGIAFAEREPALALAAISGELPELPYKGGVTRSTKGRKFGTQWYLAMWQGVRGESLYIDTAVETTLTCARFGVAVTFTSDSHRWRK